MRSGALFALVLVLCGCDLLRPKVSQQEMEDALSKWLVEHDLTASDIHCPDNQFMEKGNVFECTCKVHETDVPVRVEVIDPSDGRVEWKPKYMTMKGSEFAKEIQANPAYVEHELVVTCADAVLLSIPDSEWTCDVVDKGDGDKKYAAVIKFSDAQGAHTIDMQPQ